jgi:hypothetical protein
MNTPYARTPPAESAPAQAQAHVEIKAAGAEIATVLGIDGLSNFGQRQSTTNNYGLLRTQGNF